MPQSLAHIVLHIVFSTKIRAPFVKDPEHCSHPPIRQSTTARHHFKTNSTHCAASMESRSMNVLFGIDVFVLWPLFRPFGAGARFYTEPRALLWAGLWKALGLQI